MKRITYIIMMIYYVIMTVDLWKGLLMDINIFGIPFLCIAWLALPLEFIFYISVISVLLFTTLAHFYKGSFKIIAVICLGLMAVGNILTIFDGLTFWFCIILIPLTFYIAKKDKHIITDETETPKDKKRILKILAIILLCIALLVSALLVNIEIHKNSRTETEKQAFYEIKEDYELLADNILTYIEKTQYSEPYCVYVYEENGKAFLKGTPLVTDEAYNMEVALSLYESYQRIEQSYCDLGYSLWCIRVDNNAINFDGGTGFAIVYSIDDKSLKDKGMDTRTGMHLVCDKMEDNWYIRNSWSHAI